MGRARKLKRYDASRQRVAGLGSDRRFCSIVLCTPGANARSPDARGTSLAGLWGGDRFLTRHRRQCTGVLSGCVDHVPQGACRAESVVSSATPGRYFAASREWSAGLFRQIHARAAHLFGHVFELGAAIANRQHRFLVVHVHAGLKLQLWQHRRVNVHEAHGGMVGE